MKKLFSLIAAVFIFSGCILPAFAIESNYVIPDERIVPLVVDEADILTTAEEAELLTKLEEISERQKCDVAVATVNSIGSKTSQLFVNDYYDYYGYGYGPNDDGILFLVSMGERDWAIRTFGIAHKAFSDEGLEFISDKMLPYLSDGEYSTAFSVFAEQSDGFLTHYKTEGNAYDNGDFPKEPMSYKNILVALIVGIIIAFIVTSAMKGKLKTVRSEPLASNYVRDGSFNLTDNRDIFLTRKVTKIPIPKSNNNSRGSSSSRSSGGRIGGGASGKF